MKLIIPSIVLACLLLVACQETGQRAEQLDQQKSTQQEFGVAPRFDSQMQSPQQPTQVHSDDQPGKSMDMTGGPNRF